MEYTLDAITEGRTPATSEPAADTCQPMPVARTVYCCDRVQYQAVQAGQYRLYETEERLEDRGTK